MRNLTLGNGSMETRIVKNYRNLSHCNCSEISLRTVALSPADTCHSARCQMQLSAVVGEEKFSHSSDSVALAVSSSVPAQKRTNCHLVLDNATSLAPSVFLRVPRCLPRELTTHRIQEHPCGMHREMHHRYSRVSEKKKKKN